MFAVLLTKSSGNSIYKANSYKRMLLLPVKWVRCISFLVGGIIRVLLRFHWWKLTFYILTSNKAKKCNNNNSPLYHGQLVMVVPPITATTTPTLLTFEPFVVWWYRVEEVHALPWLRWKNVPNVCVCWNSYYYNGGTTRTTTTRTTNWWFVLSVIYQIPAFLPKRSSATTTMAHTLTHFSVRFPALDVVCVLSLCVYFDKFFVCISILADLKEVTLYLKIRPLHTEFKIHKKRKIEE